MSNNKQSSVEWYAEQSHELISNYINRDIPIEKFLILHHNLFYEAKAMHEKEIEDAELRGKEIIIIKHTEHEGGNKWDSEL